MYEGKIKPKKSQSKRIRDLLYQIWSNTNTRMDEEMFYQTRTEKMITDLQKELRELTEPPLPERE